MKKTIEKLMVKFLNAKALSFFGYIYGELYPRKKSFSQYGEDLIILNFFKKIGMHTKGFYIDIGAYHPTFISNTHLLHKEGWSGVCVDLNDEKLMWFRFKRKAMVKTICAGVSEGKTGEQIKFYKHNRVLSEIDTLNKEVAIKNRLNKGIDYIELNIPTLNVNDIFDEIDAEIDFLNIDIEGLDSLVLGAIDFNRHKPKCILFEDNINFGGSAEIVEKLESNGYKHLFSSGGSVAFYLANLIPGS